RLAGRPRGGDFGEPRLQRLQDRCRSLYDVAVRQDAYPARPAAAVRLHQRLGEQVTMPVFSVIAPAYNEATGLQEFYRRVRAVMDVLGESWELVLINDGSRDNTL